MTTEVKEIILKELIKGGVAFLVMGVAIYYLWTENSKNNAEIRKEVQSLRMETKECSRNYQNVLLNQIEKNTEMLERTNELMEAFSTRRNYNQYRRL